MATVGMKYPVAFRAFKVTMTMLVTWFEVAICGGAVFAKIFSHNAIGYKIIKDSVNSAGTDIYIVLFE